MSSTIQLKTGTGSAIPSSLTQGEVAINVDNGLFYYGSGSTNTPKQLESFTNITASGDISASGDLYSNKLFLGPNGTAKIETSTGDNEFLFSNRTHWRKSNAYISSRGNEWVLSGNGISEPNNYTEAYVHIAKEEGALKALSLDYSATGNKATFDIDTNGFLEIHPDGLSTHFSGSITASGAISASGNISGSSLHINGTTKNIIASTNGFRISGYTDLRYLESTGNTLQWRTNNDSIFELRSQNGSADDVYIHLEHADAPLTNVSIGTNQASGSFFIARDEGFDTNKDFTITGSNGYVGINEPNPTEQLSVNGNISASGDITASNLSLLGGTIDLKNSGAASKILLYCESNNAHAQTIQAAPHSDIASNTLVLPSTGTKFATQDGTETFTNKTLTSPDINTPDIDGGTIDNTVIGNSTANAGTFTSLTATNITASNLDISGDVDIDGTLEADAITVNGTALSSVIAGTTVANAVNT